MPTSTPLSIATNAVTRLLKEEEYYRKDHDAQQKQLQDLKEAQVGSGLGDNDQFMLKQRVSQTLAERNSLFGSYVLVPPLFVNSS